MTLVLVYDELLTCLMANIANSKSLLLSWENYVLREFFCAPGLVPGTRRAAWWGGGGGRHFCIFPEKIMQIRTRGTPGCPQGPEILAGRI